MNKIFVWIKRPGEPFRHVWISNTLENLQRNVGGYIETFSFREDPGHDEWATVICNEEGRIEGLERNVEISGETFVGTVIIAGTKEDEFADAPAWVGKMCKKYNKEHLYQDEIITMTLESPITKEQINLLTDAEFEHTDRIFFITPKGNKVEFVKTQREADDDNQAGI